MRIDRIIGIVTGLFVLAMQFIIVNHQNMDDLRRCGIMLFGSVGLGVALLIWKRFNVVHVMVLVPFALMGVVSLFNFVPGYTVYWMVYAVSIVGVAFLVAESEQCFLRFR